MDTCDELSIDWIEGDVMPQQVLDILALSEGGPLQSNEQDDDWKKCEVDNVLDIVFDDDEADDDC